MRLFEKHILIFMKKVGCDMSEAKSYTPSSKSDPVRYLADVDVKDWEDLDLVGYEGEGFYFWDETWTCLFGPFDTQEQCLEACKKYARDL